MDLDMTKGNRKENRGIRSDVWRGLIRGNRRCLSVEEE